MPHDLTSGLLDHLCCQTIVRFRQRHGVSAKQAQQTPKGLLALIHPTQCPFCRHSMHRPDKAIPFSRRRKKVLFQAQIYIHFPRPAPALFQDLAAVSCDLLFPHGPGLLRQRCMAGKPDGAATCSEGSFRHLCRRSCPVAKNRVRMQALRSHVIFSCLTLWSITWRDASSLRTSSTEIPISTISTITWYIRSAIS